MYVEYISNKNGYSGSFHINGPYFKTFYFILKWVKARKLPHFIFIMLYFKMVVATPGHRLHLVLSVFLLPIWAWAGMKSNRHKSYRLRLTCTRHCEGVIYIPEVIARHTRAL
jgi:hypothetical protein